MTKRLTVKKNGKNIPESAREIPLAGIITVGNESSATVFLDEPNVAPEQFIIVCEEEKMTLMCRTDGTKINGENLSQGALHNLETGDEIVVGDFLLTIESEIPQQNLPSDVKESKPVKNAESGSLNDILLGLRSEEKFYFQIFHRNGETRRVYIEADEMWLGWTEDGECILTSEAEKVFIARGQIRKDWTGILLYPLQPKDLRLNKKPVAEPQRLKNDDQIMLAGKSSATVSEDIIIRFHEPTALLVLDSILPKELPPPISLGEKPQAAPNKEEKIAEEDIHTSRVPSAPAKKRLFFGHFTFFEMLFMAVGTLVTAAIIFLVLEFY